MFAYNLLYIFIPSHIYQGFGAPVRSTPSIFQSVIACVPTGWSHLWDSSTTPISIYYGYVPIKYLHTTWNISFKIEEHFTLIHTWTCLSNICTFFIIISSNLVESAIRRYNKKRGGGTTHKCMTIEKVQKLSLMWSRVRISHMKRSWRFFFKDMP
jgi:hypothetical protein